MKVKLKPNRIKVIIANVGEHSYRRTLMPKCDFDKVAKEFSM